MRRLISLAVILSVVLVSCTYQEFEHPDSEIECDMDFSNHPRDSVYQSIIDKYVDKGIVGLSVLVRDPEEGLWIGCGGYANLEDGVEMNPNHVHYASSITKTYTATIIMLLAEDGLVDLDATIDSYLPSRITDKLPNGHKATVRNLLSHTSGIPDYIPLYQIDAFNDYNYLYSPEEHIAYTYKMKPLWEPGDGLRYSNTNFILLALIADAVTGDHADFLQERILDPLELDNTYYKNHPDYPEPQGLVNSYAEFYADGKLWNLSDIQNKLTSTYIGDDGLLATVLDFARFFECLLRGKIVSSESVEEMTTWVSETYPDIPIILDYGLGVIYWDTPYGYAVWGSGGLIGNMSEVYYFPEHDVTVLASANCTGTTTYEIFTELIDEFFAAALEE